MTGHIPKTTIPCDLAAYYFPETRQLYIYGADKLLIRETVEEPDDYWVGCDDPAIAFQAHLFQPDPDTPDKPFQMNAYRVTDGRIDTSRELPITFHECRPRFRVGDKVSFTEEAIQHIVRSFGLDDLWAQTHRKKEYEVLAVKASPEYDHIVVTVRHTAEDDMQNIAEYNLTKD